MIGKIDNCPYCNKKLEIIPTRKSKCPFCDKYIYSKTRLSDKKKVLVTEEQKNQIDEEWNKKWIEKNGRNEEEQYEIMKKKSVFSLEQFKEAGVINVKNKTRNDKDVCDICKKFSNKVFKINDLLKSEKNRIPHHIGCRCRYDISFEMFEELSQSSKQKNKIINDNTFKEKEIQQYNINNIKNNIKKLRGELQELIFTELISYNSTDSIKKGSDVWSAYKLKNILQLSEEINNELKKIKSIDVNLNKQNNLLLFTKVFSISNQYDLFRNISNDLTKLRNKIDDKYVLIATIAQLKIYLNKLKDIEKEVDNI